MLEHVPAWLGEWLSSRRAGHERLVVADPHMTLGAGRMELGSPAFASGGRLPIRFTADGEGVSPPLVWSGVPEGTASFVLIVEDPDAPATNPLVHAIVWGIPPEERGLREGAIGSDGGAAAHGEIGRNSFLREGWLPPDPPTGHGEHDYVFQFFALSERPTLSRSPGRRAVVDAMAGRVIASAVAIGTYARDDTNRK